MQNTNETLNSGNWYTQLRACSLPHMHLQLYIELAITHNSQIIGLNWHLPTRPVSVFYINANVDVICFQGMFQYASSEDGEEEPVTSSLLLSWASVKSFFAWSSCASI